MTLPEWAKGALSEVSRLFVEERRKLADRLAAELEKIYGGIDGRFAGIEKQLRDSFAVLESHDQAERNAGLLAIEKALGDLRERLATLTDGKDGKDGEPGKDGGKGEPGPPGRDGRGEKGDPGADGLSLEPMGKYDPALAYHYRDVVAWNGGSWCALRPTRPGEEPGLEADEGNQAWMLFSQRGRPGKPGEKGFKGDRGERGLAGETGERGERGASVAAVAFDGWRLRVVDSDGVELDAAPFDAMRIALDDLAARLDAIETKEGR
jgi:hypothetical protein